MNVPGDPPNGRWFSIHTSFDYQPPWTFRGMVEPTEGDWTDCHDADHVVKSITLDLAGSPDDWFILVVELPRSDEPICESAAIGCACSASGCCGEDTAEADPDVACETAQFHYQFDERSKPDQQDLTEDTATPPDSGP